MLKSLFLNICLVCFGLVLSLVAIEIVYRFAGITPGSLPWVDRPKYYYNPEAAKSLQALQHQVPKPADVFRIAVVGDSYTFAPFMQFDDAFPKKLERMLNLNNTPRRAEVVNYGVPGYSSMHEIVEVKRALSEGADLIILQVTLNDPELKPYQPTGIRVKKNPYGAIVLDEDTSRLYHYWKSLGYVATRLQNTKSHTMYRDYFFELFNDKRAVRKMRESFDEMAKLAKEKNVPFVATVFPLFGARIDTSYPFLPLHQQVDEYLKASAIPAYDLLSIYQGIPPERLQVLPGADFHPNEIAHRMAAEAIYDWLTEQKLIPQEFLIKAKYKERTQILLKPDLEVK